MAVLPVLDVLAIRAFRMPGMLWLNGILAVYGISWLNGDRRGFPPIFLWLALLWWIICAWSYIDIDLAGQLHHSLTLAALALTYLAVLASRFLLYLAPIRSPFLAGLSILFYRGIAIALLAAMLMILGGLMVRRLVRLDLPTLIGAVGLSLAFNIAFLISLPVTFDRSITMFLLARIEQHDGRLDGRGLEELFIREYLGDMRQIDRRIAEQSLSGNIRVTDGRIFLTPQGEKLLVGGRTVGGWFRADPRFVTAPAPRVAPRH